MAQPLVYLPAHEWLPSDAHPGLRAWADRGWPFAKILVLRHDGALPRSQEPVEAELVLPASSCAPAAPQVRVLALDGDTAREVPSQVCCPWREDDDLHLRLFFLADVPAAGEARYAVLYGHPEAPAPAYQTDLRVSGQGYALEIENEHFRAVLAASSGNLKSLYPKAGGAPFVGAGPPMDGGHGVEGTIHWGPDWSDEHVGRYRLTSWDGPPLFDYEVIRGPVCVRVRRWGHPVLSIGPQVGRPRKVLATVTYTFFAGQPYFLMESELRVLADIGFRDCRNDEWVVGADLGQAAWMDAEGDIGFGGRGWQHQDPRWLTFYDPATGQGFGSLHLDFENTNPAWEAPETVAIQDNRIWVRYPVRHAAMRAGERVYERNAYLLHQYRAGGQESGFADLMGHYRRLTAPLEQGDATPVPVPITVAHARQALRATNEFELYVQGSPSGPSQLSFIDIGIVRDIAVQGRDIRVDLVMPYAGRETWFGWFAARTEEALRARLADVGQVEVRLVHEPSWTPGQMTERARRLIGPADS